MSLPFLRGLVPVTAKQGNGGGTSAANDLAVTSLRLAHVPTNVARVSQRGLLAILKAKALMTRLIVRLQHFGLNAMLSALSIWSRAGSSQERRFVVFGMCHAWDDTTQKLREPQRLEAGRRSTQRVSQTILVQKCMVHSSALQLHSDGRLEFFRRAENFSIPPLQVSGKTAADLRRVMLASATWKGPLSIEDRTSMHALAGALDAVVLTFWADGASTNIRWLKHVCGLSVRDEWPAQIVIDPQELCLIHQAHRIKVNCLEAQCMIGLLFCFSKLARSGALFKHLSDNICAFVDERLDIVHGMRPPAGATAKSRELFDLIYNLDSDHHSRGMSGERKSQLWHDVHDVLAIDNSGFSSKHRIVHYCWAKGGQPCCEGAEDTRTKLKAAYINLFVSRCWPEGTLSRWTHVRTLLGLISAGFLCRGVLHTCLLPLLESSEAMAQQAQAAGQELGAEVAGAGDADEVVQHRARKVKVQGWLSKTDTPWQVAVVFLTTSILDRVTYFFMTGGQGSAPKKPGSLAKAEHPIEMRRVWQLIRTCQVEYMALLDQFGESDSPPRRLLRSMGVSDDVATSSPCLLFLRRHVLKMSIGLFRRFELRLGSFPYKLWVLDDDRVSAHARQQVVEEFHDLPSCCAGWLGGQLKKLFPTKEALAGPLCRITLSTWLRTLIFSTYACESEHASVRRITGHSIGPARNFSLVARDRVLESTRTVHMDRVRCDPRDCGELVPPKRKRTSASMLEDEEAAKHNPLFPDVGELTWQDGEPRVDAGGPQGQQDVASDMARGPSRVVFEMSVA